MQQPTVVPARRRPPMSTLLLVAVLASCSIYANLSFRVTDGTKYRYFPPFREYADFNMNDHLGAEYLNVARSMVAGKGFANPFTAQTGATAWMPPVFPCLLAGILWLSGGNEQVLMVAMIVLQVMSLVITGLIVLALVRQSSWRLASTVGLTMFVITVVSDFFMWFQFTHDMWLVLLALDLLVVGHCWWRPLGRMAVVWGIVGGLCALINPVVGGAWFIVSTFEARVERRWWNLAAAALTAAIVVLPWTIRNYAVFGRWIPVKANLAYELYQSQCLTSDGLLVRDTFFMHPYTTWNQERTEYTKLGEAVYLDQKDIEFRKSVSARPWDFLGRIGNRFTAATLRYQPFDPIEEWEIPEWVFLRRIIYPLPFLAVIFLVCSALWRPLGPARWGMIVLYVAYLTPYIAISYYDRYAVPLVPIKALLMFWASERIVALLPSRRRNRQAHLSPASRFPLGKIAVAVNHEPASLAACPVAEGVLEQT